MTAVERITHREAEEISEPIFVNEQSLDDSCALFSSVVVKVVSKTR
jgi:hypothetical protein